MNKKVRSVLYKINGAVFFLSVASMFSSSLCVGVQTSQRGAMLNKIDELSKQSPYYEEYVKEDIEELYTSYSEGKISQQKYIDEISKMESSDYKRSVVFELPDIDESTKYSIANETTRFNKLNKIEMATCFGGLAGVGLSGVGVIALNKSKEKEE